MKTYTTNYKDTFIQVAEDTKARTGTMPPTSQGRKTVAAAQFELIRDNPYKYTSDDVLFQVFADRNQLDPAAHDEARKQFFSKGQACLRTSPLCKNYGFGIHCDRNGRIALYGMETEEYQKFVTDPNLRKIKAVRSSR